jgi:DNA-binding protein H-NS
MNDVTTAPAASPVSLSDLKAARDKLNARIAEETKTNRKNTVAEIKALVEAYDIPQDELVASVFGKARKAKGTATKAEPKYQNPADTDQTWTGKGRQPEWYKTAIEGGQSPETMLISK